MVVQGESQRIAAGFLDTSTLVGNLSHEYEVLDETERPLLVHAVVDQLIAAGVAASAAPDGPDAQRLRQLADSFEALALGGSLQQQFCCDLAGDLSVRADAATALLSIVFPPLTNALILICRMGSRVARDSAVNALGAILRSSSDPAAQLRGEPPVRSNDGDPAVNEMYEEQWRRTRLSVLAIAGIPEARNEYFLGLEKEDCVTTQGLQASTELLCALPAILRAMPREPQLNDRIAGVLTRAIAQHIDRDSRSVDEEIACARHQEVLLETVAAVVRLGVAAESFDLALAKALDATPVTLLGSTDACNAQVRTTIALIGAAAAILLQVPDGTASRAFRTLVESLSDRSQWINPGIVEGCYQILPSLLSDGAAENVVAPVLSRLLADLARPTTMNDFEGTHRKLIATECFRRLLRLAARSSDEHLSAILANPTMKQVFRLFGSGSLQPVASRGVATTVIEAWALEAAWLRQSAALFEHWETWDLARRLLAIRILAMEVRACDEDRRESRSAELRQTLESLVFAGVDSETRLQLLWLLLASLPSEAAQAADADLHDFFETFGDTREADQLPGFVLAMVSSSVSSGIADAIARRIELHHRRQLRRSANADLARLLYPLILRDPDTLIFDHLLPRLSADDDRAVVLFLRRLISEVRAAVADRDVNDRISRVVDDLVRELYRTNNVVLTKLRNALDLYRELTKQQQSIWKALRDGPRGGLFDLFYWLDDLAAGQRPPLAERFSTRAVQLQNEIAQYLDLPIQRFDARASALRRAAEVVRHTEADLGRKNGPENVLLVLLLQRLQDLLENTILWYCEQPKRVRETGTPDQFWHLFVRPEYPEIDLSLLVSGDVSGALDAMFRGVESENEMTHARLVLNSQPPPSYPGQIERFERFCVEWMSSQFETESLRRALRPRWSWPFRAVYACLTSQWLLAVIVLGPFVTAAILHRIEMHSLEGMGFLIITVVAVLSLLVAVFPARGWRSDRPQQYLFECMYPRMAGLILAPMILTIELEHSYSFPVDASSAVLVLLLALSFLGTHFVVVRAVGDSRRANKVVAVAVAHAFAIAILLSSLFCGHVHETNLHDENFLWVPRAVTVDLNEVAVRLGMSRLALQPAVFYPTIIAMWLAFGLFIGVVIEGSLKEKEATHG